MRRGMGCGLRSGVQVPAGDKGPVPVLSGPQAPHLRGTRRPIPVGHCERMCECACWRQCRGVPSLLLPLALCPPGCSGAFQLDGRALWEGTPHPPAAAAPGDQRHRSAPPLPASVRPRQAHPARAATCSHHVPPTWHVISSTCGGHLGAKTFDWVTGAAPHLP